MLLFWLDMICMIKLLIELKLRVFLYAYWVLHRDILWVTISSQALYSNLSIIKPYLRQIDIVFRLLDWLLRQ